MSNHKAGESPAHRKPKVSLAMTISQGLGGPNPTPEGVLGMDSRLIFRPPFTFFNEVTQSSRLGELLDFRRQFEDFQELTGSPASAG